MTKLFLFLSLYFFLAMVYWFSYPVLRKHMTRNHDHKFLFLSNMALGILLVTILPTYLYISGVFQSTFVLVIAGLMGASSLLHHLSILHHLQKWEGIVTPPRLRVPLVHGAVSHILFSVSYFVYGILLLTSYLSLTTIFSERLVLLLFVTYIEAVAIIVGYDGLRMCRIRNI